MSYNTLDVELRSDPSIDVDQPQLLKNQGLSSRLKTVLLFSLAAAIACGTFFMGRAIVSAEGEATVSEGEATYIFSKQGVVSTSSHKTGKKKRAKGTSPACDVYYVNPAEVGANTRLVQTSALGATAGSGCEDFPPGFELCIGYQLITLPTPFYSDTAFTHVAGRYQDDGTVVGVTNQLGPDATIHKNLVLLFPDGSEIFGVEEASLSATDIFAGITAGVGRYVGASGYIELISSGSSLEVDVCLH